MRAHTYLARFPVLRASLLSYHMVFVRAKIISYINHTFRCTGSSLFKRYSACTWRITCLWPILIRTDRYLCCHVYRFIFKPSPIYLAFTRWAFCDYPLEMAFEASVRQDLNVDGDNDLGFGVLIITCYLSGKPTAADHIFNTWLSTNKVENNAILINSRIIICWCGILRMHRSILLRISTCLYQQGMGILIKLLSSLSCVSAKPYQRRPALCDRVKANIGSGYLNTMTNHRTNKHLTASTARGRSTDLTGLQHCPPCRTAVAVMKIGIY